MKKNIFVVDDSALMRSVISDIINSDVRFNVKGIAKNGRDAVEELKKNHKNYDAVLMDINMPYLDGISALSSLKKQGISIKVIMISSVAKEGADETIKALENGAFDFVTKPEGYSDIRSEKFKNKVIYAVCMACGLSDKNPFVNSVKSESNLVNTAIRRKNSVPGDIDKIVAIACSTGGPKSLNEVIPYIPADIDAPVLVVQHMPKGFTAPLAKRLDNSSKVKVKEAEENDRLVRGTVYLAPGGKHMQIEKNGSSYYIRLTDEPSREGVKPCANYMYESIAGYPFDKVICVVLTGMGADGTKGIQ
ncbi:MAG: chemotaxis-specific protein-glutamate methyltransferase CheB, partial [Lachnospiraceae bacterium]|nr:chemotaxis-specific protein-glutamate methyltransferase CheB [Lachnospiraceae bacterium]